MRAKSLEAAPPIPSEAIYGPLRLVLQSVAVTSNSNTSMHQQHQQAI